MEQTPLLEVRALRVSYPTSAGRKEALRGISFSVASGEILGLVGQSGSGKSTAAAAILKLVPPPGLIEGGSIRFDGREVLTLGRGQLQRLRGGEISLLLQNPGSAFDPIFTVGAQLTEAYLAHRPGVSRAAARLHAAQALRQAGLEEGEALLRRYPHQLSGGMLQRAALAMALICAPRLLLADEPTAALDPVLRGQLLERLAELRSRQGLAVVLISHDLTAVSGLCDRICVLCGGTVVERGPAARVLEAPAHPYTRLLAGAAAESGPARSYEGAGCPFAARCRACMQICLTREPPMLALQAEREVACWLPLRDGAEGLGLNQLKEAEP